MNIAIVLFFFSNALLAKADEYDYDYDYDYWGNEYDYCDEDYIYSSDYLVCEGDFCTHQTQGVDREIEVPILDTNLKQLDYHRYDVLTLSAIKECTPSLGIKVDMNTHYYHQTYLLHVK